MWTPEQPCVSVRTFRGIEVEPQDMFREQNDLFTCLVVPLVFSKKEC